MQSSWSLICHLSLHPSSTQSPVWLWCCMAQPMLRLFGQVDQLNEQLQTLEAEQAELARYQTADKERRSLEYTIYDKEVAQTRDKLDQVLIPACPRELHAGSVDW